MVRGSDWGAPAGRTVTYCVIPYELAERLHEPLRDHFADDPDVRVVVEYRRRERRSGSDRRRDPAAAPEPEGAEGERRRIRNPSGRRVADRRAPVEPAEPRPLPRRARRYAERLSFVEQVEHSDEQLEDIDTARIVTRSQAGDPEAFAALYRRYFERVYSYLRLVLRDPHEAEDAAQETFASALDGLARYERRRQPFRAWLFTIVRRQALSDLQKRSRVELVDPARLREREEAGEEPDQWMQALGWIKDDDLRFLVERLPAPQRQALGLRFMLDLTAAEIGEVMGRTPDDVRALLSRGQRFLRDRLTALGRAPGDQRAPRMRRLPGEASILRRRRFALLR